MPELEPKNITLREESAEGAPVYPKTSVGQVVGLDTYLEGKGYLTSSSGLATETYVDSAVGAITVPTKTSELMNDSGFLLEHQSLAGLATTQYVDGEISRLLGNGEIAEAYDTIKEISEYITAHGSEYTSLVANVEGKADKEVIFHIDLDKVNDIEKAIAKGETIEAGSELDSDVTLEGKTEADLIAAIDAGKKIRLYGHKLDEKGKAKEYLFTNVDTEVTSKGKRKIKATAVCNSHLIVKVELNTAKNVLDKFNRVDEEEMEYSAFDTKTELPDWINAPSEDGVWGLKARIVNGEPTFQWIKELSFFAISAGFIPQPTQPEIQQSILAGALTGVEVVGNEIIVKGHLADIVSHLSSNPHQQDAPHKWFGLEINTGLDTLIGTKYQGFDLTADDESEATSVGCAAGSFVLYLKAEAIVETPVTFTLTRDGYESKSISVRFVEEEVPAEEPAGE